MAAQDTEFSEIAQIAVNVHDLERATGFYRDVLELPLVLQAPGLAFFRCGSVRLMLSPAEKAEYDHPASVLYYRVGDIERAHQRLVAKVRFESPPHRVHRDARHELWLAFFRDSEGNPLALFSERPVN
jgi:methylmalonyl-CoA/ethylmalonyl-CoA epimerase